MSVGAVRDALLSTGDPHDAVRQLVALADDAGAPDNVTVIVIDVSPAGSGAVPAEPVTLGSATPALAR